MKYNLLKYNLLKYNFFALAVTLIASANIIHTSLHSDKRRVQIPAEIIEKRELLRFYKEGKASSSRLNRTLFCAVNVGSALLLKKIFTSKGNLQTQEDQIDIICRVALCLNLFIFELHNRDQQIYTDRISTTEQEIKALTAEFHNSVEPV